MFTDERATDLPVMVVMDAANTRVQVETTEGARYTGLLVAVDQNTGNVELLDVRCQGRDSSLHVMERVFVPGSRVRLMHLRSDVSRSPYLQWRTEHVQQLLNKSFKSSSATERAKRITDQAATKQRVKISTAERRKALHLREKRKKTVSQKLLQRGRK